MKKLAERNGVEVYYIPTEKRFKTSVISISFCDNLSAERAFLNALLPPVLWSGCGCCPSARELSRRIQELCIADMDSNVDRYGEIQMIQFTAEFLSSSCAEALTAALGGGAGMGTGPASFSEVFSLLLELLLHPVLENGAFPEETVRRECENLRESIRAFRNEKQEYAVQRLAERMCAGEPYSLFELGREEDAARVTGESLYRYYREYFLSRMPVKIFICGETEPEGIAELVRASGLHAEPESCGQTVLSCGYRPEKCFPKRVRRFAERAEVSGGKLVIGCRVRTDFSLAGRCALALVNEILGGGPASRLFRIVREQEGLAYSCESRVILPKGLLFCYAGIARRDRKKAERLIGKQLEEIRAGKITEEEIRTAKTVLTAELQLCRDTQYALIDHCLGRILLPGEAASLSETEAAVNAVTAEEIAACAAEIRPDTVFFLYGEDNPADNPAGNPPGEEDNPAGTLPDTPPGTGTLKGGGAV